MFALKVEAELGKSLRLGRFDWTFTSNKLASRGMLWCMGNKDRRSREAKKPKKKTPKYAPPRRDTTQPSHVVSTAMTPEKPPTGS